MGSEIVQKLAHTVGAAVESERGIQSGTQYILARGGDRAIVNLYSTGKTLVQGKGPLVEDIKRALAPVSAWKSWCGSDESGKGDFLGPLCVACVAVTPAGATDLSALGVRDCKTMTDDSVKRADETIRAKHPFKLIGWMPDEYNRRYEQAGDLNTLLASAHAEAIAAVRSKVPGIEVAVVDQFAHESLLERAIEPGLTIVQRPKADETDVAVAAASVVARAAFVRGLEKLSREYDVRLPKGAGPDVIAAARAFVAKHGRDKLRFVAKTHFKSMGSV